jgi:predicted phage-related endonuclease
MIGMPDGFMPSVQTGLEIKTAARRSNEWGRDGGDEIPVQYLLQVVYYMAITNAPAWNFAVLFSGSDLQQFRIVRDLDLERDTIEVCRQFWEEFVLKGVEPPIDQTVSYGSYLARKFSLNTGLIIKDPGPEILDWTAKMKEAEDAEKQAAEKKQLANNHLRALVGDAQKAITPLGTVGWVRPEEHNATNYKTAFEVLSVKCPGPEVVQALNEATEPRQTSAYLRAWWFKKKDKVFAEAGEF